MENVITYQSPNGETIDLTPRQIDRLREAGVWPRNSGGEYCQVSHGLHRGFPSHTDEEIDEFAAGGELCDRE